MDLSESFAPNSEQLTYPEIGERVVTVTVVKVVPRGDKPKDPAIHFAEFPGKPLLPGVHVGELLKKAWGLDGKAWVGRRMTLFGDPDVYFGKDKLGGVRVSHVSDIDAPVTIPRRGKGARGSVTVQPLAAAPSAADWAAKIAGSTSNDELRQWWQIADTKNRELIEQRVAELKAPEHDDLARDGVDNVTDLEAEK